jgi:hypothetical protein
VNFRGRCDDEDCPNSGGALTTGALLSATAGTTTGTAYVFRANTLTTGVALNITANGITTGSGLTVTSTSPAGLTGQTLANISLSGANVTPGQTTYAAKVANNHGGAGKNVALQVIASGGTTNYAIVVPSGFVGIGNSAPVTVLDVLSSGGGNIALATFGSSDGNFQLFVTNSSPESIVLGALGDLTVDGTGGRVYNKVSGPATVTGWRALAIDGYDRYAAKTSDYTLTETDDTITVDCTGGNVAITIPAANGAVGTIGGLSKQYTIKRIDGSGNSVTLTRSGADLIDGHHAGIDHPVSGRQDLLRHGDELVHWVVSPACPFPSPRVRGVLLRGCPPLTVFGHQRVSCRGRVPESRATRARVCQVVKVPIRILLLWILSMSDVRGHLLALERHCMSSTMHTLLASPAY